MSSKGGQDKKLKLRKLFWDRQFIFIELYCRKGLIDSIILSLANEKKIDKNAYSIEYLKQSCKGGKFLSFFSNNAQANHTTNSWKKKSNTKINWHIDYISTSG